MKYCNHILSTILLFVIMVILCVSTTRAQNTIGLVEYDSTNTDGYVLFSPMNGTNTYLIDKCGKEINRWSSTYLPGASCYLLEDGSMIRSGFVRNPLFSGGGSAGIIEHFNWDGTLRWSYRISSSTICSHHDFKVLPNGNILVITWQAKTRSQQVAAGRGPSLAQNTIWSESILELQPVGTNSANIVWQWDLWDHLVQDSSDTKANFGIVEDHPELVNVNYLRGGLPPVDWIHLNAIDYNATLDQIVLSSYCFDELWVIDHSTTLLEASGHAGGNSGKGGDILYRWGNPEAYGRGEASDKKLFRQHNTQWIPTGYPNEGKILIFNNGNGRPGSQFYSSIDIIAPPLNDDGTYEDIGDGPFGPTDYYWEYTAPVKTDLYSPLISGVQMLKNGSIMICEGSTGEFWEVDSTGKRVWKYINPLAGNAPRTQGQAPANNSVFRCTFYPSNYSGFAGRTLTPKKELELQPTKPPLCEKLMITTLSNSGVYCAGSALTARYNSNGPFFADNMFYFELSDSLGSFSTPLLIDSLNAADATPFNVILPANLPASDKYRYRISSSHPAVIGSDNGFDIKIASLPNVTFDVLNPYNVCNFTEPVRITASGGVSYQWDDGVTGASRLITKPGRYYVTLSNSFACERRDSIDINSLPSLDVKITATKPLTICDGSSVGLLASGGTYYRWSTGDTTRLVVATKEGWYTVTATDPFGCSGTDSIYVTVAPAPIISITPDGTISLCPGDTVTVTAAAAANYHWSNGDTTQTIKVSTPGTYFVSTMVNNCPGISTVLVVKVLQAPQKPLIVRSGNMLTTTAELPLQWYNDGQLIVGATGKSYTPSTDGVFTVVTTGANNCTAISDAYNYLLLAVAPDEIRSPNITISPNPFTDHITIGIESASPASYEVECYTVLGEKVSTIFSGIVSVGENELNYFFPKNNKSEGVYFIRIRSGAFTKTFKVVGQ